MTENRQDLYTRFSIDQKPSRGGWDAAIFIISVEAAERFAYSGLSGNLIIYLPDYLHQPIAAAAKNVNIWVGVSTLFALLGAIVADSFLGRFKTIILSTSIYLRANCKYKDVDSPRYGPKHSPRCSVVEFQHKYKQSHETQLVQDQYNPKKRQIARHVMFLAPKLSKGEESSSTHDLETF